MLLVIVLLPVLVSALFLFEPVQNKVVDWAAEYVHTEYGVKISIGSIYVKPISSLVLSDFLVLELNERDTLLFVADLSAELNTFKSDPLSLNFTQIYLEDGFFNLRVEKGDTISNLQYILNNIPKSEDESQQDLILAGDDIELNDFQFLYSDDNKERKSVDQIDFNHFNVQSINGALKGVWWQADSVRANVCGLNLTEQSGFLLRDLQTELSLGDGLIRFQELLLQTNSGIVQGSFVMDGSGWGNYRNFLHEVELKADLYDSEIYFNDLAYFTPTLKGLLIPFKFSGHVEGTVDDLRSEIEMLSFGQESALSGIVKVKGLPDIETTFIDADIEQLKASIADAGMVNFPQNGSYKRIEFPSAIHRLEFVGFQGRFTGFVNDFVTFGNIETALGFVDVDMNIKTDGGFQYAGDIASSNFRLGYLLDAEPGLKDVGMHLKVKGSGLALKTLNVTAQGKVHHIEVNKYDYQQLDVDGTFEQLIFNGSVAVEDENIDLRFKGMVDLNDELPHISSHIDIDRIHLANLNLLPTDTFGSIKGEVDIVMNGNNLHNLNGELHLKDVHYSNRDRSIELDELRLSDKLIKSGHNIELTSEVADVKVIGKTSLFDLPYAFSSVAHHYMPSFLSALKSPDADTLQDFHFDARISNDPDLWQLIYPGLVFKKDVFLQGRLATRGHSFILNADTLDWSVDGLEFHNQSFEVYPANNDLIVKTEAENFQLTGDYGLNHFRTYSSIRKDSVLGSIDWNNDGVVGDSGSVDMILFRSEDYPLNVSLEDLIVRVADVEWVSQNKARVSADSTHMIIKEVLLQSEEGKFQCDGTLNRDAPSVLNFDVLHFNLEYLSNFGFVNQDLEGMLGGDIDLYYQNANLIVDGNVGVDSLSLDGIEIGDVDGSARYSNALKKVILDASLKRDGFNNLQLMGDYYPTRSQDQLDIEVAFSEFQVKTIEPFIDQFASNLTGVIDGAASITGTLKSPDINGLLSVNNLSTKVNYLNTNYSIDETKVKLYPDLIAMDVAEMKDEKGAIAITTVQVFHDYFTEWSYDVFLEANNFLCLNSTIAENESYYGVANITGDINIGGYAAHNAIDVEATTDEDTKLFIPLSSGGEVSQFDYIRFVNNDGFTVSHQENALAEELKGLELDFRLAVDDDAEVQIIFDEKVGDIIKAKGAGDMLMQIDNRGKFNMYGDYVISKGEYLFTLQNVINKRFKVVPGSRITWNGDVAEANLDLSALYNLKASPAVMVAAMTGVEAENVDEVYKQRLPVDVSLLMEGPMSAPEIDFGVKLPSLPETDRANQLISPAVASKEQITSQAFSLLLAKNFSPGNGNISLGGAGQSSGFEVLSNQLSNWASQYSDKFDVGVNYRDAYSDEAGNAGSETEVSLSTAFFDDRVSVEVNGTVQGSGSEEESGNVAGEFNVEYKINKDGSLRARAYNESNYNSAATVNQSPYTQGIGIFYQREFDTWGEFFKQTFSRKKN